MFFSIIIPTYNPNKYLPAALQAIATNKCIDDIEVIISDDISTEPFDDVLAQFPMLHIRVIQNDKHYGFPRPGRQHGLEEVQGEWICFQDQDDYFCDYTFDKVREYIIKNHIQNTLYTGVEHHSNDDESVSYTPMDIYTHGKFFELSFLRKNNINYDKLIYSEDINFTRKIILTCIKNNIEPNIWEESFYIWVKSKGSISQQETYHCAVISDTIQSTFVPIVQMIQHESLTGAQMYTIYDMGMHDLLSFYFYSQTANNDEEKEILKTKMKETLQPYIPIFLSYLEIDIKELKSILTSNKVEYTLIRNMTAEQYPFIEYMTIYDWIDEYIAPLV